MSRHLSTAYQRSLPKKGIRLSPISPEGGEPPWLTPDAGSGRSRSTTTQTNPNIFKRKIHSHAGELYDPRGKGPYTLHTMVTSPLLTTLRDLAGQRAAPCASSRPLT